MIREFVTLLDGDEDRSLSDDYIQKFFKSSFKKRSQNTLDGVEVGLNGTNTTSGATAAKKSRFQKLKTVFKLGKQTK